MLNERLNEVLKEVLDEQYEVENVESGNITPEQEAEWDSCVDKFASLIADIVKKSKN